MSDKRASGTTHRPSSSHSSRYSFYWKRLTAVSFRSRLPSASSSLSEESRSEIMTDHSESHNGGSESSSTFYQENDSQSGLSHEEPQRVLSHTSSNAHELERRRSNFCFNDTFYSSVCLPHLRYAGNIFLFQKISTFILTGLVESREFFIDNYKLRTATHVGIVTISIDSGKPLTIALML